MQTLKETIKFLTNCFNIKTEKAVAKELFKNSLTIATAESCTGGLVSSRLTDIAGSSSFIKENYVTYANEAKMKLLGVSEKTLSTYGAVSEECAKEMVEGLYTKSGCDIALATTGIAGPGGATATKNVGLMYVAIKDKSNTIIKRIELAPWHKRKTMKFLFSQNALELLIDFLNNINSKKKN